MNESFFLFKNVELVEITDEQSSYFKKQGTISFIHGNEIWVYIDEDSISFHYSQLTPVK